MPLSAARFAGAQLPGITRHRTDGDGWSYTPTLRLDPHEKLLLPVDGREPGVVALALLQRVMAGGDVPEQGAYPKAGGDSAATLQRNLRHVLKDSKQLDLVGLRYLDGGALPKMTGGDEPVKSTAQVQIKSQPNKVRWTLTLQGHEGTSRLRDVTPKGPPTKKTP